MASAAQLTNPTRFAMPRDIRRFESGDADVLSLVDMYLFSRQGNEALARFGAAVFPV